MEPIPEFSIGVQPRCYEPLGVLPSANCGELAGWMRAGRGAFDVAYFCDAHHAATDVALPVSYVFRRLHLEAHIWIAEASRLTGAGQVEAVTRLERSLELAGAVMAVQQWRSTYGRFTRLPSPTNTNKLLGRG